MPVLGVVCFMEIPDEEERRVVKPAKSSTTKTATKVRKAKAASKHSGPSTKPVAASSSPARRAQRRSSKFAASICSLSTLAPTDTVGWLSHRPHRRDVITLGSDCSGYGSDYLSMKSCRRNMSKSSS